MATTVKYKGATIATVDNQTKTLTTAGTWVEGDITLADTSVHPSGSQTYTANGTYDVTALAEAVVDVQGSGGNMGGLANMADVTYNDNDVAYMLTCMKNGDTVGGTITWANSFPNTETLLLSTGLTTLHGVMLAIANSVKLNDNQYTQANKWLFLAVRPDDSTLANVMSAYGVAVARSFSYEFDTSQTANPIQGKLRISGGDLYYTGRYNGNNSYQIVRSGQPYDWIAW